MLPLVSSLQQPAVHSSDVLEIERPASRASNISSETDTSSMSSSLERWDDKHVKLLISCYGDHKHLFGKGKATKREIFSRIAYSFNRQSELMVTGDQCMRKWTKLKITTTRLAMIKEKLSFMMNCLNALGQIQK